MKLKRKNEEEIGEMNLLLWLIMVWMVEIRGLNMDDRRRKQLAKRWQFENEDLNGTQLKKKNNNPDERGKRKPTHDILINHRVACYYYEIFLQPFLCSK